MLASFGGGGCSARSSGSELRSELRAKKLSKRVAPAFCHADCLGPRGPRPINIAAKKLGKSIVRGGACLQTHRASRMVAGGSSRGAAGKAPAHQGSKNASSRQQTSGVPARGGHDERSPSNPMIRRGPFLHFGQTSHCETLSAVTCQKKCDLYEVSGMVPAGWLVGHRPSAIVSGSQHLPEGAAPPQGDRRTSPAMDRCAKGEGGV